MKKMINNPEFHEEIGKWVDKLHEHLRSKGFDAKLAKLSFHPQLGDNECECGTETFFNPVTKKFETSCVRCDDAAQ